MIRKILVLLATPSLIATILLSSSALANPPRFQTENTSGHGVCIALRGNGELMPAHWGALAATIETYGAPLAMAGGSSASITSFLWESMEANPQIRAIKSPMEKAQVEALLFKFLEDFVYDRMQEPKWNELLTWLRQLENKNPESSLKKITELFLSLQNPADAKAKSQKILQALNTLKESKIFYGPAVRKTLAAYNSSDPLLFQQKLFELKATLAVFGKFDAKNDTQLFLRDGIIDFSALAHAMGAIGDLYSLRSASPAVSRQFTGFIKNCAQTTAGLSPREILRSRPDCSEQYRSWVRSYLKDYAPNAKSRIFDGVGEYSPAIISTSVLSGESAQKFLASKKAYEASPSNSAGDMRVESDDLSFGYWGDASLLNYIRQRLDKTIDKSERFLALAPATWELAMSLSPAEPGLSPFQAIPGTRKISLGGWSDLHPVQILKAAGCQDIVYVTRRGGDSLFGIGVAKRLLGMPEISWEYLDGNGPGKAQSQKLNQNGRARDTSSAWGKMFNLKNPQSSFANALSEASAVVCTDWNAFDVKNDFSKMIASSYAAPIYEAKSLARLGLKRMNWLRPADLQQKSTKGDYPEFAGCIPY